VIKQSELKPDYRCFELEDGRKFGAHKKSCLFCKHNTDIFYDYTNGPYMFFCELEVDDARFAQDYVKMSFEGKCPKWESDGTENGKEDI
jgi:hypothetical protein